MGEKRAYFLEKARVSVGIGFFWDFRGYGSI